MFVSIAVDSGSEERARELGDLLFRYGFKKMQWGLWESAALAPDILDKLKKDLDNATDANDKLRLFQYPIDGTLVITSLLEKKWRRMAVKGVK